MYITIQYYSTHLVIKCIQYALFVFHSLRVGLVYSGKYIGLLCNFRLPQLGVVRSPHLKIKIKIKIAFLVRSETLKNVV